jgi:polyvinyl alcohol dehydrogenase (cytochrome)
LHGTLVGDSIANALDYDTIAFEKFRIGITIFLMKIITYSASVLFLIAALPCVAQDSSQKQRLGTEFGISAFERECTKCHGNAAVDRAPTPAAIRQMPPERIYAALTTGVMQTEAAKLNDEQKRRLAEYMGGRPLGSAALGDANQMPNHCPAGATRPDPGKGPSWNGWGVDVHNTRFQDAAAAGITPEQVSRLKLKWAFGFPLGVSAFGQPSIAAGRVFVGSDIGYVYSLDMQTGCVYWSYQTKAAVRTAVTIGPTGSGNSSRYAVYLGDMQANVYALDAASGALLWTRHVEDHFSARITAAPTLYHGRLFVPVSTSEGFSASTLDYPCCTFRGSVVALNAGTGTEVWKTYTIPEPKPIKKNSIGTQLWAPSGVAVWNSPTVDAKRHAVYFGTGDSATEPAPDTSDSIMAVDLNSGKPLWHFQAEPNDATLGGCFGKNKTENCPDNPGPDWDFGASPMLKTIAGGRDLLLAPNKSGIVFALDPDHKGTVVWKTDLSEKKGTRNTNLVWGGSADQQNLYVGLVTGALTAVQLATGEKVWTTHLAQPESRVSYAAASSTIPGAVFIGGTDGKLHALSSSDGHELWSFDTARDFTTVNNVPAHGGSIGSIGPTIAGGMVFIGSGYSVTSGMPGNVLLAFAPQ